jgi:hypothetical protein
MKICTPPLTRVTPVSPPAPAPADCFVDGVFNPPAPQDGVIWTVTPENQTGPGTYTVTAAPAQGYTFPAGAQPTWTVIVDPQQTEGCDAVGGTEDNDTDQNEDSDVAGSEDELAATGANFGPAGLGLLLILSGAAFVTARRLALR